jgi:hypothetical protein
MQMTEIGTGVEFDVVLGGRPLNVVGRVVGEKAHDLTFVLAVQGQDDSSEEVHGIVVWGDWIYAVVCDHRQGANKPGVIRAGALNWHAPEGRSGFDDVEDDDLVSVWSRVLEAIDRGEAVTPSPDKGYEGTFTRGTEALVNWKSPQDFEVRFLDDPDRYDDQCRFSASITVDGHHMSWKADHVCSGPMSAPEDVSGWATFDGDIALTSFRVGEWTNLPFICFAAAGLLPPDGEDDRARAWLMSWAHAMEVGGELPQEIIDAKSVA